MLAASVFLILACGDYTGESPLEPTPPPPDPSPSNEVSFVVQPKVLEVRVGKTGQVEAEVRDANGQPVPGFTVHWETPDPPVAEVDDQGTVYGNGADSIYVTAEAIRDSDGMLFIDSTLVAVTGNMKPARELDVEPDSMALEPGNARALDATAKDSKGNPQNRKVRWESSSPDVATVDGDGLVSAVGSGEATITARSGGLEEQVPVVVEDPTVPPVAQVEVSPGSLELEEDQSGTLEATARDADGDVLDRAVSWSSSDASVATVDASGVVSAEAEGEATITATSEGVSGSATVTVVAPEVASVAAVEVSPGSLELEEGQSGTLEATARDADGDVLDRAVSWSSSDASVATVDASGVVSAEAEGEATITATSEGVSGSATVTVVAPEPAPTASNPRAYTNEPSGYTPVVEFDGSAVPPNYYDEPICNSGPMRVGCAVSEPVFTEADHASITDASAPVDDQVLRVVFPEGMGGGGSPGFFNLWGPRSENVDWLSISDDPPDAFDLEEMYYSAHVRLTSGSGDGKWEMGNHLKLLGYFSFAQASPSYNLAMPYVLDFHGDPDTPKLIESSKLYFSQQGPGSVAQDDKLNVWNYGGVQVDRWHHLELLATLNDIGKKNGTLRVYIDGSLVLDTGGIEWRTAADPRGFTVINVGQVWGGTGETRSRTDYVDIDNIYVSGIELTQSGG